jgi:hypothetical protein
MAATPPPGTGSIPAQPSLTGDQVRTLDAFAAWCDHRARHGRHSAPRRAVIRAAANLARLYVRTHS